MRFGRKGLTPVLLSALLFMYATVMVLPGLNIHIRPFIQEASNGRFALPLAADLLQ